MRRRKSNKNVTFEYDDDKSYIYLTEKGKQIGILMWHYQKKKWVFDDSQIRRTK